MSEFFHLTVGDKFDRDLPDESMSIILMNGSPMLTFNFSLTGKQVSTFLNGTASFSLFYDRDILFFLFKIDGFLDWSDLAFSIHLAGGEKVEEGDGYLPFNLVLIDSKTSIIKGLRIVTVSPYFRSVLSELTQQQTKVPFDIISYYKTIGELYETYPSASDFLKAALIIEKGGKTLPK
jgi:hypothetical protein